MRLATGALNRRVTFRRRQKIAALAGNERGAFRDLMTVRALYRRTGNAELLQGGGAADIESGILTVRDTPRARTITAADRVVIGGRDFAITGVALPVRAAGTIDMQVSSRPAG